MKNIAKFVGNSEEIFHKKDNVCIGISPLNSYFKVDTIKKLAEWGLNNFDSVNFFIPDKQLAHNFRAYGDPENKIIRKVNQKGNYTNNLVLRALDDLGFEEEQARSMIMNWNKLASNEIYLLNHDNVKDYFNQDSDFKERCINTSLECIGKEKRSSIGKQKEILDVEEAAKYLLSEIPLFTNSPSILEVNSSVFAYHHELEFIEDLHNNKFKIKPEINQGYVVLKEFK